MEKLGSEWEIENVDPKGMIWRLIKTTTTPLGQAPVLDPHNIDEVGHEEDLNGRVEPLSGITVPRTGKAIRDYLLSMKKGSPTDVYRELRKVKRRASYDSVRRYFWILNRLGLIQLVRESGRFMNVYRITPGMEEDPRWSAPQVALYPQTKLGSTRYKKAGGSVHRDSPATNIRINRETREILRSIRVEGETYDDVLRRIAHEELKEMEGEDQEDEMRGEPRSSDFY